MDSTIKAFTYLTSKEVQRKVAKDYLFFSPIPSLYNEEEVCKELDCEFFKSAQLISRPINITDDYNLYSSKFRNYIFEYLYGNRTVSDVLKDIENLTKVYYLSLSFNDSFNITIFFILFIISSLMIGSLIFLHVRKYEPYFKFLLKKEWYMFIFGLVSMLWNFYYEMEKTTRLRCHLNKHFTSFIFYCIFIPILRKLIACFPEENKVSEWINHHKSIFLISFIIVDEFLISLILFNPYDVQKFTFKDGKTIEECKINNGVSIFFLILSGLIKLFVILAICLLIFLEWNVSTIRKDVKVMSIALYMDIILLMAYIIVDHISVNKYTSFFLMKELIYTLIILVNFIFIYFYKIIKITFFKKNDNEMETILNKLIANSKEMMCEDINSNPNTEKKSSTSKGSNSSLDAYMKIINYHFKKSANSLSNDNGNTGNT